MPGNPRPRCPSNAQGTRDREPRATETEEPKRRPRNPRPRSPSNAQGTQDQRTRAINTEEPEQRPRNPSPRNPSHQDEGTRANPKKKPRPKNRTPSSDNSRDLSPDPPFVRRTRRSPPGKAFLCFIARVMRLKAGGRASPPQKRIRTSSQRGRRPNNQAIYEGTYDEAPSGSANTQAPNGPRNDQQQQQAQHKTK